MQASDPPKNKLYTKPSAPLIKLINPSGADGFWVMPLANLYKYLPLSQTRHTMPLLTATALSYRTLFDNVSFTLHHGQKVALVGRLGSGKSVLLQDLSRFIAFGQYYHR